MGAHIGVRLHHFLRRRQNAGLFLLTLDVLAVELQGELPHFVGQRFVRREQQARRDIGAAHAAGGIHAGRQHERDVKAVDGLAGQAAHVQQRAQADFVGTARQQVEAELRDHAILADERHHVRQRADGGDLDEPRHALSRPDRRSSACTSFSATPTPARYLSG